MNGIQQEMAEPLHIQRLEAALDMRPFMSYVRETLAKPLSESESEQEKDENNEATAGSKRKSHKSRLLGSKEGWFDFLLHTQLYINHIFEF